MFLLVCTRMLAECVLVYDVVRFSFGENCIFFQFFIPLAVVKFYLAGKVRENVLLLEKFSKSTMMLVGRTLGCFYFNPPLSPFSFYFAYFLVGRRIIAFWMRFNTRCLKRWQKLSPDPDVESNNWSFFTRIFTSTYIWKMQYLWRFDVQISKKKLTKTTPNDLITSHVQKYQKNPKHEDHFSREVDHRNFF